MLMFIGLAHLSHSNFWGVIFAITMLLLTDLTQETQGHTVTLSLSIHHYFTHARAHTCTNTNTPEHTHTPAHTSARAYSFPLSLAVDWPKLEIHQNLNTKYNLSACSGQFALAPWAMLKLSSLIRTVGSTFDSSFWGRMHLKVCVTFDALSCAEKDTQVHNSTLQSKPFDAQNIIIRV